MHEIAAQEEQRLVQIPGERVGETVTEVKLGGMAASLTKITIRLAGETGLGLGYGDDRDTRRSQEVIEAAAGHRIAAPVDYRANLHEVGGRKAPVHGLGQRLGHDRCFRLGPQNGDEGGGI